MRIKQIEGYEGLYSVTECGEIISHPKKYAHKKDIIRKKQVNKGGYYYVFLNKNNKATSHLISRLVAKAFVSNPDNKPHVNHIDENKLNNHYTNLEWTTVYENWKHSEHSAFKPEVPVQKIDKLTLEIVSEYKSLSDASKETGIHIDCIANSCSSSRRQKTAGGFRWRRTNDGNYTDWKRKELIKISKEDHYIQKLDKDTLEVLDEYCSHADAARANNIKRSNISACVRGKQNTSGGFKWRRKPL